MGPASSPAGAPVEAVYFGHHLDPLPGDEVPYTPQIILSSGDTTPQPISPGASPPLFTLHRSLLL